MKTRERLAELFETLLNDGPDMDELLCEWANADHSDTYGDGRLWIERNDVGEWINDDDAVIVDISPVADFNKGHIVNARNLPASRLAKPDAEIEKLKDKKLNIPKLKNPRTNTRKLKNITMNIRKLSILNDD